MTDTDLDVPTASTAPSEGADAARTAAKMDKQRPRHWPWLLALLLLCGSAILVLWAIHALREAGADQARMHAQIEASELQLERLQQGLEQLRQEQQRLTQRLDGSTATNKVLREELLGMGERAGLLEDAVARLAQSRMGGDSALRLNEAEFLLTIGAARLDLYGDAAGTITAFSLAEDVLAGLEDPALATLRQTLAQELNQLREMPADPRNGIRAELATLAAQLANLPPAPGSEPPAATASDSRLGQLLARLVTVRRYDPQASLLGPSQRQAALATVALQLELAQSALNQPDVTAFRAALERVQDAMAGLFDPADADVAHWSARLAQLRQAKLTADLPAVGATLRELRSLRAVRQAQTGTRLRLPPVPDPERPAASDAAPLTPATPAPAPAQEPPATDEQDAAPELERSHGVRR